MRDVTKRSACEACTQWPMRMQALMLKQATLVQAQRLLEQRALAEVLHEPLGFQNSRPTAALLVHRCLVHWSSFSSDDAASKALLEGLIRSVSQEVDEDEVTARCEAMRGVEKGGGVSDARCCNCAWAVCG